MLILDQLSYCGFPHGRTLLVSPNAVLACILNVVGVDLDRAIGDSLEEVCLSGCFMEYRCRGLLPVLGVPG